MPAAADRDARRLPTPSRIYCDARLPLFRGLENQVAGASIGTHEPFLNESVMSPAAVTMRYQPALSSASFLVVFQLRIVTEA
jgi:hypothetical protein